jgi:hypothetical protein
MPRPDKEKTEEMKRKCIEILERDDIDAFVFMGGNTENPEGVLCVHAPTHCISYWMWQLVDNNKGMATVIADGISAGMEMEKKNNINSANNMDKIRKQSNWN